MKLTSETKLLALMGAIVALGVGFLTYTNRVMGTPETPPTPRPTPGPRRSTGWSFASRSKW